ncbi:MAG TPA: nuclear transport factor 2 family protein [Rubrobacteraceae bacterium]|nr:nuclear transport factor 2 family protein [Rubrobacteraceae bacterium]
MTTVDDFDQVFEQWQPASGEFLKGNPEPVKKLWSRREDVSLANPFGPPARGWEQVAKIIEHAASQVRDGELTSIEIVAKYVTPELAYVVQIERPKAKIGGSEDITPFALRVTMICRPEDGTWKIVHRHADPITTPQPAESVIQE